jgi:hypothetical protein
VFAGKSSVELRMVQGWRRFHCALVGAAVKAAMAPGRQRNFRGIPEGAPVETQQLTFDLYGAFRFSFP